MSKIGGGKHVSFSSGDERKDDVMKKLFGENSPNLSSNSIASSWKNISTKDNTAANSIWPGLDDGYLTYGEAPDFPTNFTDQAALNKVDNIPNNIFIPDIISPGVSSAADLSSTNTDEVMVNFNKNDDSTMAKDKYYWPDTNNMPKNPAVTSKNISKVAVGVTIEFGKSEVKLTSVK